MTRSIIGDLLAATGRSLQEWVYERILQPLERRDHISRLRVAGAPIAGVGRVAESAHHQQATDPVQRQQPALVLQQHDALARHLQRQLPVLCRAHHLPAVSARVATLAEANQLAELAQAEITQLDVELGQLQSQLEILLIPKDPGDEKSAIIEIRAGTGGEEAALFAANLYRMYAKYIENKGWKIDVMNTHDTGIGGIKEIIFSVEGKGVYGELKMESGVHRVQRVPQTEASGRIHTSAASVAVLLAHLAWRRPLVFGMAEAEVAEDLPDG